MDFKLLHTADVHLGTKLNTFGPIKGEEQRRQIKLTLEKLVNKAIDEKFSVILIAGDLFDSNSPSYETVGFVKNQLMKMNEAGIYCFILPGTHDCLSKESIYLREKFNSGLDHIFIFDDPKINKFEVPLLDLTVWGKPNTGNRSEESPIIKKTLSTTNVNVLMAHGSFQIEGKSAKNDFPIDKEGILVSNMDYVALGHWHGAADYSCGKTIAWYSGSPEITYTEGKGGLGSGYVLEVEIENSKITKAAPVKIGQRDFRDIEIDVSSMEDMADVVKEIERFADTDLIASVNLKGLKSESLFIDTDIIKNQLDEKFFLLNISDNSERKILISDDFYPEQTMISQFIRLSKKRMQETKDEREKEKLKRAFEMGLALLNKKEIL
jgi:DNA repair exonuclease SbcCD nuclease subunit